MFDGSFGMSSPFVNLKVKKKWDRINYIGPLIMLFVLPDGVVESLPKV